MKERGRDKGRMRENREREIKSTSKRSKNVWERTEKLELESKRNSTKGLKSVKERKRECEREKERV